MPVLVSHALDHGRELLQSLPIVPRGRVLLALPELQLLKHLPKAIDIPLGTGDPPLHLRGHKLTLGHLSFDIELAILGDFHGEHKLPE